MVRSGSDWQFGDSRLRRSETAGVFRLTTKPRALFSFLSAVFADTKGQDIAVTLSRAEDAETIVVIHSDVGPLPDRFELATLRFVEAGDLLASFDRFRDRMTTLLGQIDAAAGPQAAPLEVSSAPAFLLAGLSPVTPETEALVIVVLTNPAGRALDALRDIVGVASAETYDAEHHGFVDTVSGRPADALDFVSDRGPVVELRFTVARRDAALVPELVAARLAGRPETAHLVVGEDFETFAFRIRPIGPTGDLGDVLTLTYDP